MCLVATNNEIKEAETEIECYKVVKYTFYKGYETPRLGLNIKYPIIKGETPLVAVGDEDVKYNETEHYTEVNRGFIHVFKTKNSAALYAEILDTFNDDGDYKVFRCTIPKGTKYYDGYFPYYCGQMSSYATKQIVFYKEIDWRDIINKPPFSDTPGLHFGDAIKYLLPSNMRV